MAAVPGTQTIPYNEDYSLMIYQNDKITNDTYITIDMRYSLAGLIGSNDTYTGEFNTDLIVDFSGVNKTVSKECKDLVLATYSDWYCPSIDELNAIYYAGYTVTGYDFWSSTEVTSTTAKSLNTTTGANPNSTKTTFYATIPVRKVYLSDVITIERMNLTSINAPILNGGVNNADEDVYKMLGGINGISKNSKIMTNE
jgi:hypothetical protein